MHVGACLWFWFSKFIDFLEFCILGYRKSRFSRFLLISLDSSRIFLDSMGEPFVGGGCLFFIFLNGFPPGHVARYVKFQRCVRRAVGHRQGGPHLAQGVYVIPLRSNISVAILGLHACLLSGMHACLRACLRDCLLACMFASLRACVRACSRACVCACLLAPK